uniref:Thioredoxin domain-containing protein n=1 Tax=Opuntia streptacantha TaxID=393608 RepID=A0A7C8ZSF6_OPUST
MMRFCAIVGLGFVLLVGFLGLIGAEEPARVSDRGSCPVVSLSDAILGFRDSLCDLPRGGSSYDVAVIEGDEASLQKALHLVHSLNQDYVAVLFYASWCPFSRNFRPSFSVLSSLYPSIPHFAIEESAIRPSILSKYGVHGFPTLFLLNSTVRVRYRGPRTLSSLVAFYSDVTGIKGDTRDPLASDKIEILSSPESSEKNELENCPFSWARSPENLLRQETYLALATAFVLLRLLYLLFPYLLEFACRAWRRYTQHVRIGTLWERPLCYLNKAKQLFNSIMDARKRTNFQGGAINARAWASKSLASAVALGDAPSRGAGLSANH